MGNEVEKQPTKYKFVIQGVLDSSWTAFHKNEPDEKPVDFLNRSVMQDKKPTDTWIKVISFCLNGSLLSKGIWD